MSFVVEVPKGKQGKVRKELEAMAHVTAHGNNTGEIKPPDSPGLVLAYKSGKTENEFLIDVRANPKGIPESEIKERLHKDLAKLSA